MADYSGDIPVADAWSDLASKPDATLIDVRTAAEWNYVGAPDLDTIGKATHFIAWNDLPSGHVPADFSARLRVELVIAGISVEAPLYFICRSGQRSRNAAIAATAAGHLHCFNVMDGFEGGLDPDGHRGTDGSWKAAELPWRQS